MSSSADPPMAGANQGRETELKLALASKAELDAVRLVVGGRAVAPVKQENHFFDSADRVLDAAKHACRLRREGDAFIVTVKGPSKASEGGLLTERAEEEVKVSWGQADRMLKGLASPLAAFGTRGAAKPAVVGEVEVLLAGKPLVYIGGFRNLRTRVNADVTVGGRAVGVVFEFDETTFPGNRIDFELEVEVPAGVDAAALKTALDGICTRARVTPRAASSTLKRFMTVLQAMRKA